MVTLIGIDPGLDGAVAFFNQESRDLDIFDMPTITHVRAGKKRREIDAATLLAYMEAKIKPIENRNQMRAVIERGGVRPGEGAVQSWRNGVNWAMAYMTLVALRVPHDIVSPAEWKVRLRAPAIKDASRQRASELLPEHAGKWPLKKHDGRAEAAMIALYGRYGKMLSGAVT